MVELWFYFGAQQGLVYVGLLEQTTGKKMSEHFEIVSVFLCVFSEVQLI